MAKPLQLPSGKWRIQWFDTHGKRRSSTFQTEAQARASLRRNLVELDDIRSGRARPRSEMTLAEASADWLSHRPETRRRDDAGRLEHHIVPYLGPTKLGDITPTVVQKFIRHLEGKTTKRKGEKNDEGRKLRPGTINTILITFRKMMNDLDYPLRIKYKVPNESYNWLRTPADVSAFLEECGNDWFRMAAELAVYAGLRKGEIAGLVWSAIDFERGMIRVARSYDGPTKNRHTRWVPLSPPLAKSLKRWRMRHGGILVVTAPRRDGEGGLESLPITRVTEVAKRTRRACRRAGVPEVKFHELRDTYASHLAERVSLPIIGAVLGHADPKTTARYAHIDTEGLARDPRLHLNFDTPSGKVLALEPLEADCTQNAHEQPATKRATSK